VNNLEFNESDIVKKLIQTGYKEHVAQSLGSRLIVADVIREPLAKWIKSGEETNCTFEEISAFALMRERNHTYPAALSVIAWLYEDPKAAREALSQKVCIIVGGTE